MEPEKTLSNHNHFLSKNKGIGITPPDFNIYYKKWKWQWKSLSRVQLSAPPWPTVHGILQVRILEWVAFPFSRGSSQPRDRTQVSHIAGGFFTCWATREAHYKK